MSGAGPGAPPRPAGDIDASGEAVACRAGGFGAAGSPGTRLLAGPPGGAGPEALEDHQARLGSLGLDHTSPASLRRLVAQSGLTGRGGGQFPLARKLDLVAATAGRPLVVVNASESEPASRKDRTVAALRPHLVLDGALAAAHATGAAEVLVYLHRTRRSATRALEAALVERESAPVPVRLVDAPDRYVSGESSAVVAYLEGRGALPRQRRTPVAAAGVGGRPTLVSNLETIAHLGLLARFGPTWFRTAGTATEPGSSLVTLAGDVAVPGLVAEVLEPVTIGRILSALGGLDGPPRAVLLGGYEGTWIDGEVAWRTPLDRGALARVGTPLGCGLLAVLGDGSCGIATTARLLDWLAGESAGQCGPCILGLPELADRFSHLAEAGSRTDERALRRLVASLQGRGACGHPSGAARLAESALDAFADEIRHHRRRRCESDAGPFPLPGRGGGDR